MVILCATAVLCMQPRFKERGPHTACVFFCLAGTDIFVQKFVAANVSTVNIEENAICVV